MGECRKCFETQFTDSFEKIKCFSSIDGISNVFKKQEQHISSKNLFLENVCCT